MGFRNPFPRPWMEKTGAAAAVGGSSVGLKGIVAGKYYRNCKAVQVWLPEGKRLPQSWWVVEYCTFGLDMQTRNVKVERWEICVERRPGPNLSAVAWKNWGEACNNDDLGTGFSKYDVSLVTIVCQLHFKYISHKPPLFSGCTSIFFT